MGDMTENNFFYKADYGERGRPYHAAFNGALDASDLALAGVSNLITAWATVEDMLVLVPQDPTYISASSFFMPGDQSNFFEVGTRVQAYLDDGVIKWSPVASYDVETGIVVLEDEILTDPVHAIYATVSRDGLLPYGPGYVVARSFGLPGQQAIEDALAAIGVLDRTLVITPGDWEIDDDLEVLPNVRVFIERGGKLAVATTKTVTFSGTFASGRYHVISCTGTGKVIFGDGAVREVFPEWWGDNTFPGAIDMAPMIQAAIDSRAAWGATTGIKYPIISFSSADYLIESALNLTTTYVAGTMQHDCVHLRGTGYGGGGTRIIGNTGNLMIDTCGSIFIKIEDIALSSEVAGLSNPSTVAILQARPAVNPQCQFHTYRNVSIAMHDDAAANGGMGTIGIMNYAGESVTYDTMFVRANLPVVLTCLETHLYTDSVYQPLGLVSGYHSMGSVKFTGHNNLWTLNRRQPAMILHGVVDLLFNGEITSVPAPAVGDGTNDVAFTFGGPYPCVGITINAVVEALGTVFNIECSIEGLNANIVSGNPLNPSAPLIYLIANLGYISESDIKLLLADNIERNLVTASGVTGSYFRNTTIKTTQAKSYAIDTLPGNLVSNSTHKGFVVEAVDGRFDSNTRLANWSAAAIPVPATAGFDGALETQTCFYNVVGDEVTVRFYFRGVSNQTYFRFTLPFAANAVMPAQLSFSVQVIDNGIAKAAPGMIAIPAGSTTADIYIDGVATVFTAANAKAAVGEIKYYRDPNYPG